MRKLPEPYEYKSSGVPKLKGVNRFERIGEKELLTGVVKGQRASDLEERFARALYKNKRVLGFQFQVSLLAGRNLPGEKRVDFLVNTGRIVPVEVDGYFSHRNAVQRGRDAIKEILLNEYFQRAGYMPLLRVPGHELGSQENADRRVRELF
ncbi:MAG: hypothetical protein DWQ07_23250 [Chloroflexi bacterium]|nr:MAG: hypothetical protein DWQ07_23250 [Chloroflexota bacterium]MBL1194067.1 hypothetical protein [Chloroflexota bacterium]NOH11361.1 hypothetical protein [Chloroflexota bacterium]